MYAYTSIQKGMQWKDKNYIQDGGHPLGKEKDGDPIGEGSTVGFNYICNITFLKLGGEYIDVNSIILYTFVQV